jgi:hypothetical protein
MQYLSFVDPKGIHHLDLSDAKFQLYKNVKEIETRLANPKVVLNVFILLSSPCPSTQAFQPSSCPARSARSRYTW